VEGIPTIPDASVENSAWKEQSIRPLLGLVVANVTSGSFESFSSPMAKATALISCRRWEDSEGDPRNRPSEADGSARRRLESTATAMLTWLTAEFLVSSWRHPRVVPTRRVQSEGDGRILPVWQSMGAEMSISPMPETASFMAVLYLRVFFKEVLAGGVWSKSAIGTGWVIPRGIAVDAGGNVYVPDQTRGIFKEDLADPPTLTFAATAVNTVGVDSPKTETISNLGTSSLQFSSLSYPGDFPEASGVSSDCTPATSLPAGSLSMGPATSTLQIPVVTLSTKKPWKTAITFKALSAPGFFRPRGWPLTRLEIFMLLTTATV